jgi:predicted RNase H-like nuclease
VVEAAKARPDRTGTLEPHIAPTSASAHLNPLVAGLDGCRTGWVLVTAPLRVGTGPSRVRVVADLHEVVEDLRAGTLAAAAIDVPIGLAPDHPRTVDTLARHSLGPRRSSVFSAPVRPVLASTSYDEACRISRAVSGRAVSRQLFGILPKIREVDALMTAHPGLQERMAEMHPELSFTVLAGAPMRANKKTPEGRFERLAALRGAFPDVDVLCASRRRGTQLDDVVDAFVGAWTARRFATGSFLRLGGEADATGLRMEMIA